MAGKRSRKRLRCKAGRRVATKHAPAVFTVRNSSYYKWKRGKSIIRCPCCKSDDIADYEAIYIKTHKRDNCHCHGVPHPHEKGTHRLCDYHKLRDIPLTEDEERDAEDVLRNARRTSFS